MFSYYSEGVVDIHITVGETETKSFEAMQFNRKNQDLPFFVKVACCLLLFAHYSFVIV